MIRDLKNSSLFSAAYPPTGSIALSACRGWWCVAFPPQTALTLFACLGLLRVHFSEMRDECVAVPVNNLFYIPQNIFVIAPQRLLPHHLPCRHHIPVVHQLDEVNASRVMRQVEGDEVCLKNCCNFAAISKNKNFSIFENESN